MQQSWRGGGEKVQGQGDEALGRPTSRGRGPATNAANLKHQAKDPSEREKSGLDMDPFRSTRSAEGVIRGSRLRDTNPKAPSQKLSDKLREK